MRRILKIAGLAFCAMLLSASVARTSSGPLAVRVDISVNNKAPQEFGRFDPWAYLMKKDGKRYASAGEKFRIDSTGKVEAEVPDLQSEYALQVFLPGALSPVLSEPLRPGALKWDIEAAVIEIRNGPEATEASLYRKVSGEYANLWKRSKALGNVILMPLPEGGPFVAGMAWKGGTRYSGQLRPGEQVWDLSQNMPPEIEGLKDEMVDEGGRTVVHLSAKDPEGESVRFTLVKAPSFAAMRDWKDGSCSIVIRPSGGDAGTHTIELSASDKSQSTKTSFKVFVAAAPVLPAAKAPKSLPLSNDADYLSGSRLTAVWANDGSDKVTKDELRSTRGINVRNSVWDDSTVSLFGARNEVVSFNLVLEAGKADARGIGVELDRLLGPKGAEIASVEAPADKLFDFRNREIELFQIRYLQIKGLSRLSYDPTYDERHVPVRFRLPYSLPRGTSAGSFAERPDAYKYYPDIAVPLEAVGRFDIKAGENQGVWVDVYIPKDSPAGTYKGKIRVAENGKTTIEVPVALEVMPFSLPDEPVDRTMVYFSEEDLNDRYIGKKWPDFSKEPVQRRELMERVWNAHQLLAHRHRVSLIDDGTARPEKMERWKPVLSGKLFTKPNGYEGPGEGVSGGVYSIGTYGGWRRMWDPESEKSMEENGNLWASWFEKNFPGVDYFLYLSDEPKRADFEKVERWASWVRNGKHGKGLKTLAVTSIVNAKKYMPSLDIAFTGWGDAGEYRPITEELIKGKKEFWAYNGWRPATGSFAIEDDGVSLRSLGWTQFKHKINRWFYWDSTNYKNRSHVSVETNVFREAWTFGRKDDRLSAKYGETGHDYNNGDGVLFYPGTDRRYPEDSYNIPGPIASLRLKLWRRGIQDADYLAMASAIDPAAVDALVKKMVPKALWEVGVSDPKDPTYVHADISWPLDPDEWENARRALAKIILSRKR